MPADDANSGNSSNDVTTDPGANIAIGQIVLGAVVGIILGVLASHFVQPTTRALFSAASSATPRRTHYHYAANGVRDAEWVYKNGRIVAHHLDRNLDGAFDYWAYYDADGYVSRAEEDNNFDGKPDEFWTYSNNEVTGMEKDDDFNGVPDEFLTYKFHLPQQVDIRPNGSKLVTVREILSNGIVTEIWRDEDSNGNFREKVAYDPFFNPIRTNSLFQPLLSVPEH